MSMSRLTNKAVTHLATLAVAAFSFAAAQADATDPELEQVRQKVGEMFDAIDPDDVSSSPVDGWYMIHRGSVVVYISADGRYLLQGDLVDLDSQVNLSEKVRNESRRDLLAGVSDDQTIIFSPEEVKYSVSVFTDVECTYCRRLHSQIDQYLAHGIRIRYLMYPRNGPASRAWTTAEDVWCASDRQNALTMAKLDREFPTNKCDASIVQDHYVMGRDVGLSGTPAIVLEDGTLIGGYIAPDQLIATLEGKAAE
jgi:thiol:disulfide interchange protein DsbC